MIDINISNPKQLKSDTRQWNSGRVKLSVIGWDGKPDKNYIILEKNFFGKAIHPDQHFNLKQSDWENLKKLVDEEYLHFTGWKKFSSLSKENISELLESDPNLLTKIFIPENLTKLSSASLESLDKFIVNVYEIKKDMVDLIIKRLSETNTEDVDKFGSLLQDLKLSQVSMMASMVYQKLKIIDVLEQTVISRESKERDIHRIFESNPWLLGNSYEILKSEKTLSDYLNVHIKVDPETSKRPDIIAKIVPNSADLVLVEFKSPQVKLKAKNIGQVLEYEEIIRQYRPNTKLVHKFLLGYEKENSFVMSKDVEIKTFSEIISEKKQEYQEYQNVLELGKEIDTEID